MRENDINSNSRTGATALSVWKMAASAGVISLMLCAATGFALAAKPGGGGGGGHPGGGGGHPGGGGGHPGGGGAPHFGGGGAPHFGGGGPHFTAHAAAPHFSAARASAPHFSSAHFSSARGAHFSRPAFRAHAASGSRFNHANLSHTNASHALATPSHVTAHALATAHTLPAARQAAFHSDPRAFAAHREQFAHNAAFRPFWNHGWHRWHHLGWIGPLFWPYAYGDFFYYALWPDYYYDVDPFWAYGYGDVYSAIFSPYDYDDYVQGPRAPARMATLTEGMAQSCSDEAAEVTGWPVDQIQAAVQPNQQQTALLDDLGNALVKASDEVKSHCPTTVSFTPTARLAEMQQRLQALVDAIDIVKPPLDNFYAALSDEQKARFNAIAPADAKHPQGRQQGQQAAVNPQSQCSANIMAWPGDQIDRAVKPDDAQRTKLQALQSAAAQASDTIKAACPAEIPATPPARLGAVGQRLDAMLQGVKSIRPALSDFYDSLSDDQKARFNGMGRQLFAQNQE